MTTLDNKKIFCLHLLGQVQLGMVELISICSLSSAKVCSSTRDDRLQNGMTTGISWVKFLRDATGLSSNKFFQGALVYNGVCCSMFLHVGYSWGDRLPQTTLPFYDINHCSVASISPMQPYSALLPPYSYLEQFA